MPWAITDGLCFTAPRALSLKDDNTTPHSLRAIYAVHIQAIGEPGVAHGEWRRQLDRVYNALITINLAASSPNAASLSEH